MAKVLGETGRYVTEQSIKKYQKQFMTLFLAFGFLALSLGFLLGGRFRPYAVIPGVLFIGILPFAMKKLDRIVDELERERLNYRKGATGEAIVGRILENFPDGFYVIHDLSTPYGNLDHVVIGATGAYVIDTKNWKGVVASDGNGELLWNGQPTKKAEVKNLTGRIMGIREKVLTLASLDDLFIQGVFAFPSAYIEARWGSTGTVHCVRDEQLYAYIVENKKGKKLSKKEIESISQAFLALARMDKGFEPGNEKARMDK
ncbi:MAG: nuclease-related domain-containing protein [Nitrospiraceae bacterium]|nr:nuclease-related domain-containing protein [Nitrospiraceae bacterium]